jgi:methyltransferase
MVNYSLYFYWAFLALVGLERLWELFLSKRNAKWAFENGAIEVGQKHYRVMTVFHTLFLVCSALEPWLLSRPFLVPYSYLALVLSIAAQGLRYWAITTLGKRWNTRVIVFPEWIPVTTGPYKFIRHPNYVAVILELCVLPLIHGAYLTSVIFSVGNALLLRVRIKVEEEALGINYAEAFKEKARFVPKKRLK